MAIILISLCGGLSLLVWSADRFVTGSALLGSRLGMSPLLVGLIVVGFGTSAPEMVVSVLASVGGRGGLALGNAYGSNIVNIALILGISALIKPIAVHSSVLRKELPILTAVTLLSAVLLYDLRLSRTDGIILLLLFIVLIGWTIYAGMHGQGDVLSDEIRESINSEKLKSRTALFWAVSGLIILIISSRIFIWGAVRLAGLLGVNNMIIGLTVVAVGTSLPELASSIAAVRKGENDIALGNIMGSNLFNTLAVAGLSGVIHPVDIHKSFFLRDILGMFILTVFLVIISAGLKGRQGRINRVEGSALFLWYVLYSLNLFFKLW